MTTKENTIRLTLDEADYRYIVEAVTCWSEVAPSSLFRQRAAWALEALMFNDGGS